MKSWGNITGIISRTMLSLAVVAVFGVSLFSSACTREGDETLGYELLPEQQRMDMRHKCFMGGMVKRYDVATGEYVDEVLENRLFTTTLYRTDSIVSSNLQTGYAGVQSDKVYGRRTAGFATQFLYYYNYGLDSIELTGFEYKPIFDSLTIDLSISDYGGDTLRPIKYEVYELLSSLSGSFNDDGKAYIDHDMSELYDASKPLFTFSFPDPKNALYTTTVGVTAEPVDMSKTGVTWDFVKRLMMASDDADWDGYAKGSVYRDTENWTSNFRGLYIKPVEDQLADGEEGGVYAVDLSASGFTLYGRTRNPKEERLVKDTIIVQYNFYTSGSEVGNKSVNIVSHDYAGSELDGFVTDDATSGDSWSREENRKARTVSPTGYVEGMGGVVTELYLENEFLKQLRNISVEDEYNYAAVNQARLYIYLDGANYDWTKLDASLMTPLLDDAVPRLGLYSDYVSRTPIIDYSYVYETDDSALRFGGYPVRSWACYVMDISSYIQLLKNYVDELNPEADDDFDYEDASAGFNPEDTNYVPRTLYLAPEAYGLYTFNRSKIQGMEDAVNKASLRFELTYTMLK